MSASHVFVFASCVAFTAVIVWWMRHAPARLLRLVATRDEAIEDDGEVFDTQSRNAFELDAQLIADVEQIMDEPEGREYRTALDFDAWEAECACRPRIAKYAAQLEERAK